eukprot:1221340-Rhodomonas_salina.2
MYAKVENHLMTPNFVPEPPPIPPPGTKSNRHSKVTKLVLTWLGSGLHRHSTNGFVDHRGIPTSIG